MIEIFTVSETAGQTPLLVELNVNVTEPAAMSAGVMLYDVVNELFPGLKDPAPAVPQVPVPCVLTVPLSDITGELEHKAWFGPAFTVAMGTMVTEVVFVTAGQGVLFEEVKLNVTVPAIISEAVKL